MIKRKCAGLLLALVLILSCQKEHFESNCRSVAYVIDSVNSSGKICRTDTSICWPEVCDSELVRFESLGSKPEPMCGRPKCFMRLVIFKPDERFMALVVRHR